MNSELRKKTAECGETCSAKRTQTSRKGKAGKELRMTNYELRKKTAECGETSSAKGTHRECKCKAGNGKSRKVKTSKVQKKGFRS